MSHSRKNRKKLIIEPKFQMTFIKWLMFLFFLLSLAIVAFSWHQYLNLESLLINQSIDPSVPVNIFNHFQRMLLYQVIFLFILSLIIAFWGLFVSHRIAGPIYRLKKYFKSIKDDQPTSHLNFRKYDEFQDVAESFNSCIDHLKNKYSLSVHEKDKFLSELESILEDFDNEEIKNEILTQISRYKTGAILEKKK